MNREPDGYRSLPRAGVADSARVFSKIVGPLIQRGVIVRRPSQVRLLERANADQGAVELMQDLRRKYGPGPLRLRMPGRRAVLILSPEHVHRVLEESPEPFHPATREKKSALAHFEPAGALISATEDRPERRRFNETALDTHREVHSGAEQMIAKINDEVDQLLTDIDASGELVWDDYITHWMRMVRRITFGEGAADDEQVTDDMLSLRSHANWAFFHPKRRQTRARLLERIDHHLKRAEPGSLAAYAAGAPAGENTFPEHQVPQWLFAFDAAAWASYRALGLLGSHASQAQIFREETAGLDLRQPHKHHYARACVLESLRLWPTTPAVLRETTKRTHWEAGPIPEGTLVFIFAPFFHRDDETLEGANEFVPALWEEERTIADWPLIPFSAGPVICPARNLVLHVTSTVLTRIFTERNLVLEGDRLDPEKRLPGTLDPFTLRFRASR